VRKRRLGRPRSPERLAAERRAAAAEAVHSAVAAATKAAAAAAAASVESAAAQVSYREAAAITAAAKRTAKSAQRTAARAAAVSRTAAAAASHFSGSFVLPQAVPGAGVAPAAGGGDRPVPKRSRRGCSGGRPQLYLASCRHGGPSAEQVCKTAAGEVVDHDGARSGVGRGGDHGARQGVAH